MSESIYHPLTRAQEYLVDLVDLTPSPEALNLIVRIDFQEGLNLDALKEALLITGEQLPYCRIRIHRDTEGSASQYVSEEAPEPIQTIDLRKATAEEIQTIVEKIAREPFPNNNIDVQLYRFCILLLPNERYTMLFCVHHLIMDAYAMMYTVQYLDKVYASLINGTNLPAPAVLPWDLLDQENR